MKRKTLRKIGRSLFAFIKKTVRLIIFTAVLALAFFWFSKNAYTPVDTAEIDRFYDDLKHRAAPADVLTLSLGLDQDDSIQQAMEQVGMKPVDNLPVALGRLQGAMGLGQYPIELVYGDQEKPPAFVTNYNGERMTITVSDKVKLRREQLSLLVHELSHISVWELDRSFGMDEGKNDKERLVDTSGFFRGQGILTLNGLTDTTSLNSEGGYSTEQKLFGYLKPEQFGYLLARYCAEHGIPAYRVEPFLTLAGRKYFGIGAEYLKRTPLAAAKPSGKAAGVYWCPQCGQRIPVDLSKDSPGIRCTNCSFYFKTQSEWAIRLRELWVLARTQWRSRIGEWSKGAL